MSKKFYEILGVAHDASQDDIKRAFRKLAQKYHPDKHRGEKEAEEKFKDINEAYEVLKDPSKRAHYDRFGTAGPGPGAGPGAGYNDVGFGDFQDIFSDVFTDFFGGSRRAESHRGADLRYDLEITFEEAAFGTEKVIQIPKSSNCSTCNGTGAKKGTTAETCRSCAGQGQVRAQQGFFTVAKTCPSCRGEGKIIKNPCTGCSGTGRERKTSDISVKIPPGVDTGSRLRLTGEGDAGQRGAPRGDLYIVVNVKEHSIFERQNDDVVCEVPITFTQATLGAEIGVPTLDGPVKIKIPAGTQSHRVFRLTGKGIASLHSGRRGDEHVIIKIETPSKLNKRQRELLEEFARISGEETSPMNKSFFDKVKELF